MSKQRLFEIVYLLLERKRLTARELAQRFEVSERTIYRDIDALSAAGVPVYTAQGKGGGISLMEHYVLDRAAFSAQEQRHMLTALQSLPASARADAKETIAKLSAIFRCQEADWLMVDLSRWGNATADQAKFEQLRQAILEHRQIVFDYVGAQGEPRKRGVLPARLVFKSQAWYLQGFCLERQDYRIFRLTRMLSVEITDEVFTKRLQPPPIDLDNWEKKQNVCIVLRFAPWMAYRVYDEFDQGCVTRQADGSLLVKACFPEDGWLYGYVLSFGTAVEVLQPLALRKRLAVLAREIWQVNTEPDTRSQVLPGILRTIKEKEAFQMNPKDIVFCQSCGMPLYEEAAYGTEEGGAKSEHYCKFCYQNGQFTNPAITMEEMIAFCVPHMVEGNPGLTPEQARAQMMQFFPKLMRWKQES